MKKYVIDASVAVKWYSQEEEGDLTKADNLLQLHVDGFCEFMAPALIVYELANALRFNPNLGVEEVRRAIRSFFALEVVLEEPARHMDAAIELAYTLSVTVYDAIYLALSQTTGIPLITADYKFFAKAKDLPFIEPLRDLNL